ncbi:MAG: DUF721 domain-containing protein [Myxococcaceae bacterium]
MAGAEPLRLSDLLPQFLARLARAGGTTSGLQAIWREVAGQSIAKHARVTAVRDQTWLVQVDDAQWLSVLQKQQQPLSEKLAARTGADHVALEFHAT